MSDLQKAIDWWDNEGSFHHGVGHIVEMVEAARLVANPNISAARHALAENKSLPEIVAAALTPGEDE